MGVNAPYAVPQDAERSIAQMHERVNRLWGTVENAFEQYDTSGDGNWLTTS